MTESIYVFNKYNTLYHSIITNAISQNRYIGEIYYENHHIKPKSFNGSNDPTNLVLLTAREHYLCHYLLTKFTIGKYKSKMSFAFHLMNIPNKKHKRYINSKLYSEIKLNMSNDTKNKISLSHIGKKHSEENEKFSIRYKEPPF